MKYLSLALLSAGLLTAFTATSAQTTAPLRVAIAGMVHGHVEGFLQHSLHRPDIQIVGFAEPDNQVAMRYVAQFSLDRSLIFTDLEDMLEKTHPQAVLAYTNTYDHRKVVEICAGHGVHVMMEKPMAVSAEDAHAISDAAHKGKIQVLAEEMVTARRDRPSGGGVHRATSRRSTAVVAARAIHVPVHVRVSTKSCTRSTSAATATAVGVLNDVCAAWSATPVSIS